MSYIRLRQLYSVTSATAELITDVIVLITSLTDFFAQSKRFVFTSYRRACRRDLLNFLNMKTFITHFAFGRH